MSQEPEMPSAGTDDVDVFLCRPDLVEDPALLADYFALLDAEERARHAGYRFEQDGRAFIVSHALVRAALSQCADMPPGAWRFRRNRHGRPEIDHPAQFPLRFSLSHTRDLVACVVSRTLAVGIDVETLEDSTDVIALAERFFAPLEVSALQALPIERRLDRFFSTWTLKEAYAKARGLGLSLPLHCAAFVIDKDLIEVRFEAEAADHPNDWSFSLMRPTRKHWLAVAARSGDASSPRMKPRWLLPLTNQNSADPCPIVAATRP